MRKSLFAGLTVLDEDESFLTDGGAFIGRDRDTIDRFLQLGAKTHRHDGSTGLAEPTATPSASVVASGGSIPADLALAVGYTVEDSSGGETMLSPTVTISTPSPVDAPTSAPVASADYSAGQLLADAYYYAKSWTDGIGGETPIGPATLVERAPGYANGRIGLTGLASGMAFASAAGWRLYRAIGGGDWGYLASGTADTFMDEGTLSPDCDITPMPDDINTTNSDNTLLVRIPSGGAIDQATAINVYGSEGGTFAGSVHLGVYPLASAGQEIIYRALDYGDAQPPDTNQSIGGAGQIDAELELQNLYWRAPVLGIPTGSGAPGDVRLARDLARIYGRLGSGAASGADQWTWLSSGSVRSVAGSGAAPLDGIAHLIFEASGGAGVDVTTLGGGSARVQIGAGGGGGGGGMGASALLDVNDADGPTVADIGELQFRASGDVSLGVTDQGAGVARVTIFASAVPGPAGPQGPAGPAGGGGSLNFRASGEADTLFSAPSAMIFQASGALGAHAEDLGGGSAKVLFAPHGRRWASATIAGLASGASGAVEMALGAGHRLLEIRTNRKARVRSYATPADRLADVGRGVGTDPTGDHGVVMDFLTTADLSWRFTPTVDGHNMEEPPSNAVPLSVTNFDPTGDVIVAFLYIPTEVV